MEPQINADERRSAINAAAERIIGGAQQVSNALGNGFLEKVYENALAIELKRPGLKTKPQHPISVRYAGETVGEYVADLLVENAVLVEVKAVRALDEVHRAQCLNYLATGLPACLLLNFGNPKLEIKRLVHGF